MPQSKVLVTYLSLRSARANSMVEFGPALIILLICIFFPLVDMLAVALAYCNGQVLNSNQVHEASLVDWHEAVSPNGTVCKGIPDQWLNGMGKFVKVSSPPSTLISYRDGESTTGVTDKIVSVTTTLACTPFLSIPLPVFNIPGLNGPMVFSITSERPMENPDYAGPSNAGGTGGVAGASSPSATMMSPGAAAAAAGPSGPAGPGGPSGPAGPGGPSGPAGPGGPSGPAGPGGPSGPAGPGGPSGPAGPGGPSGPAGPGGPSGPAGPGGPSGPAGP
ncbi:MAG: hypothetical protein Q8T09_03290, partial [Candidatus Melainabacteria bacterium]|nr:hypothetical protein [Candidatus Melainabacteria bacterium]